MVVLILISLVQLCVTTMLLAVVALAVSERDGKQRGPGKSIRQLHDQTVRALFDAAASDRTPEP